MTDLFNNSHDALTFAFNYSSQQFAQSQMAQMMKSGIVGTGKGLVSLDGAGQAGLIRKQVDKLTPIQKACIVARYSPRFGECSCCGSHEMILPEYKEAIGTLGQWALSTFSGMSMRVAREYIIRSYYERGLSIRVVAEQTRIGKSTLYDYKAKIVAELKNADNGAQVAVDKLIETLFGADMKKLAPEKTIQ